LTTSSPPASSSISTRAPRSCDGARRAPATARAAITTTHAQLEIEHGLHGLDVEGSEAMILDARELQ